MPHVDYAGPVRESTFRRMAMAAWSAPADPTIYGYMDFDSRRAGARMAALRAEGVRVTWTHFVARALARALAELPEANVMPRRGRSWQRERVDIFLQVALPSDDGLQSTDLSGVKIRDADQKALPAFAAEVSEKVARVKKHDDPELAATKSRLALIPRIVLRPVLRLVGWLQREMNWDLKWLGLPRDPFGSAMVTSLGMLGVETAFAPLFPLGGPPIVVTVGSVTERAVVEDGEIVARPLLRLSGTFDHRAFDGYHIATLAQALRRHFEEGADDL